LAAFFQTQALSVNATPWPTLASRLSITQHTPHLFNPSIDIFHNLRLALIELQRALPGMGPPYFTMQYQQRLGLAFLKQIHSQHPFAGLTRLLTCS